MAVLYVTNSSFAFPLVLVLLPMSVYAVRRKNVRALAVCAAAIFAVACADAGMRAVFSRGYAIDFFFSSGKVYGGVALTAWLCLIPAVLSWAERGKLDSANVFERGTNILLATAAACGAFAIVLFAVWERRVAAGPLPVFALGSLFGVFFVLMDVCLSRAVPPWRKLLFPASRHLLLAVRSTIVAALLLACLLGWMLYGRVSAYGWTPNRVLAATFLLAAGGWAIVWAWGILPRSAGGSPARCKINLAALLLTGFLAFALLTPPFNPHKLAADTQAARLIAGKVSAEAFDYDFLVYLGEPGKRALERLSKAEGFEGAELVRERASHELGVRNWKWL